MTLNGCAINRNLDFKTQSSAPTTPLVNNVYSDGTNLLQYRGASYAAVGRANDFGGNFAFDWADCEGTLSSETRSATTDTTARTATKWAYLSGASAPAAETSAPLNGTTSVKCLLAAANEFLETPLFRVAKGYAGKAINLSFLLNTDIATATTDHTVKVLRYNSSRVYQETLVVKYAGFLGIETLQGFFISNSDETSYYSIAVVENVASPDPTIIVDSFYIGMKSMPVGMAGSDSQTYTPTFTGFTTAFNGSTAFTYWRVGEMLHIQGTIKIGTNLPNGIITFTLPAGLTPNWTKYNLGIIGLDSYQKLGNAYAYGSASFTGEVSRQGAGNTISFTGSSGEWNATVPFTFAATDTIQFQMSVPIIGWSSGVTMLNSDRVKSVVHSYANTDQAIPATTWTVVALDTVVTDQKGEFNTSAYTFTPKTSGYYNVVPSISFVKTTAATVAAFYISIGTSATPGAGFLYTKNDELQSTSGAGAVSVREAIFNSIYLTAGVPIYVQIYSAGSALTLSRDAGYIRTTRLMIEQLTDRDALAGLPISGNNIVGRTDGVAPAAGFIGQEITGSFTKAIVGSGANTVGVITPPAGIWYFSCEYNFDTTAGDLIFCIWDLVSLIIATPTTVTGSYSGGALPSRRFVATGSNSITITASNGYARGTVYANYYAVRIA